MTQFNHITLTGPEKAGVVNGYPVGCLLYANTAASTAHTNTTTEAIFDKYATIPADWLTAGTVVKIRFQGIATATNGTDTLTIKLYLGGLAGTVLIAEAATDVADSNVFQGEYTLIFRTVGASGTVVGCGTYKSIPAAEGTMTIKDDILPSTSVDTTQDLKIGVGADWSAASTGDSCRLDVLVVEAYPVAA
jgi:hypothetical protein